MDAKPLRISDCRFWIEESSSVLNVLRAFGNSPLFCPDFSGVPTLARNPQSETFCKLFDRLRINSSGTIPNPKSEIPNPQ